MTELLDVPAISRGLPSVPPPELDPYLSDNLDFGFEYYTGQEGYFGVAAFRKGIEGFTVAQTSTVPFSSSKSSFVIGSPPSKSRRTF